MIPEDGASEYAHYAIEAEKIARPAGALLREFYARGVRMEYKGEVDLVTEADRASEAMIVSRLRDVFPSHGVVGEEGTRSRETAKFRWYVDPLDGTTNFAHTFPQFCVSMGLERRAPGTSPEADGELIAGVIYDPMRDELFSASKGGGATLNGAPIRVSRTPWLQESLLGTGFPSQKRHRNPNVHFYQQFTLRSHGVRRAGSAALDLAYVACGRLDGYWEFNLNPWDTSAGALLVTEAGGQMSGFDGAPFALASREILATNGNIHPELIALFGDMFAGRDLDPIPTPQEYAARRAQALQSESR